MDKKAFSANGAAVVGPYSQAIGAGDLVFLSGQTPMDPETKKLVSGSIAEQTRRCLLNLFSVLEAAGLTPAHVVKTTVFLTNMANFAEMNAEYKTHFSEPFPARSTIGVQELPLGAEVEIELIAHR
ncbi:Rid family detoxifying hydrolase [Treponema zuelzerae]|uniref:Rid family detoxifying hydrolase n=1 Tax=Teretinema zuelzerae TaxID=156 RepID=A0AAE3JMY7_9SPIR|nr:Rid family detoxifying hydrolase [Teretinema zuelzerae]MCD1656129.1 Rid family detoxifying hydrolase [Teretinema zuelzerae]HPO02093.1 Rid family detoxifying hydrolase [Treponemataceae bacterium]HQL34294.1 Rid family detoxifying hydrolase [Treponemataceae bacterium]